MSRCDSAEKARFDGKTDRCHGRHMSYIAEMRYDTESGSELEVAMMPLGLESAALSTLVFGQGESLPRPTRLALARQSLLQFSTFILAIRQSSNHPCKYAVLLPMCFTNLSHYPCQACDACVIAANLWFVGIPRRMVRSSYTTNLISSAPPHFPVYWKKEKPPR